MLGRTRCSHRDLQGLNSSSPGSRNAAAFMMEEMSRRITVERRSAKSYCIRLRIVAAEERRDFCERTWTDGTDTAWYWQLLFGLVDMPLSWIEQATWVRYRCTSAVIPGTSTVVCRLRPRMEEWNFSTGKAGPLTYRCTNEIVPRVLAVICDLRSRVAGWSFPSDWNGAVRKYPHD